MSQEQQKAAPPQLMFDDGSRIMTVAADEVQQSQKLVSPRGLVPIEDYYEVERLSRSIIEIAKDRENEDDGFSCRVALQLPDELLEDGPDVCWAMENALSLEKELPPLVFILGDTTFGSCCPDEISALHLQADVLVHYGHACLSPAMSLPVLYGFGVTDMDVAACAESIIEKAAEESVSEFLLLYEVRYYHAMRQLQAHLQDVGGVVITLGSIPTPSPATNDNNGPDGASKGCCQGAPDQRGCEQVDKPKPLQEQISSDLTGKDDDDHTGNASERETFVVGGLHVSRDLDLSTVTLLYIGDVSPGESVSSSRQYVNTMMRFLSAPQSPANLWTYSPTNKLLETTLPASLNRQLNRRFYLVQKARDASVFGILVGTLSQRHFQTVVSALRNVIESADRACYTFAVGKINGAKLANFGEIDCFVLVACGENSLLDDERDFHVPVITPLELDMALGNVEWGSTAYSLDYNDFLTNDNRIVEETASWEDDEDAPYFSLVTGQYEPSKKKNAIGASNDVDLVALPGKGQLTEYKSAASEFLSKREYKGLEANVGGTNVQAAREGQTGIASDYGHR